MYQCDGLAHHQNVGSSPLYKITAEGFGKVRLIWNNNLSVEREAFERLDRGSAHEVACMLQLVDQSDLTTLTGTTNVRNRDLSAFSPDFRTTSHIAAGDRPCFMPFESLTLQIWSVRCR